MNDYKINQHFILLWTHKKCEKSIMQMQNMSQNIIIQENWKNSYNYYFVGYCMTSPTKKKKSQPFINED